MVGSTLRSTRSMGYVPCERKPVPTCHSNAVQMAMRADVRCGIHFSQLKGHKSRIQSPQTKLYRRRDIHTSTCYDVLPDLPGREVFSHIPYIFFCFVPTVTSAFPVHHRQELRAYRRKRFCCLWVDLGFTPKHKPHIVSGTELPPVWLVPTSTARIESQPRAYRPGGELHFPTASYLGPL